MKKLALITGASSGIGLELAHIHAKNGGDLILVARSENKLLQIKEELEAKHRIAVLILVKDLSQANAANEIYQSVQDHGLMPDYLINNAGFGGVGKFVDRPLDTDLNMIDLNIKALTSLSHLFLKAFLARKSGRILNVSSTASLVPGPLQAVYFASKAYVRSFSNALAEECRNTGVSVTNFMPGATETEFGKVSGMDKTALFSSPAQASKVALDGYNAMLKGKLDVISGLSLSQRLMFAFIPFTPKRMVLKQIRQMQKVKD